jgi:hypothetical protein
MASHTNPAITASGGATRLTLVFLWLAGACFGLASAEDVPLPKSRPSVWMEPHTFREAAGPDFDSADVTSAPTECDQRLRAIAAIEPVPRLIGPDACGGEHGKGNAVDLRSFILADGRVVTLTDVTVAKDFRDGLRDSVCHRFTTVLGPGSDSAHESHIHVDLIERRGYRMCQWDVRTPPPKEVAAGVPLPAPRPSIDRSTASRKM